MFELIRPPATTDLSWIVRALERECIIRRIPTNQWLQVPYSRFARYCPRSVADEIIAMYGMTEPEHRNGMITDFVVPSCVYRAEEEGLITVKRNRGKAHSYRLTCHPGVMAVFQETRAMIMPGTPTMH